MSAIIRACAILARSFDSGSGHAGLGITQDAALEASVAARTEYDRGRRVLDAMSAIPDGTLRTLLELNVITFSSSVRDALKAEQARRASQSGDEIAGNPPDQPENEPDSR